ncbi:MAG: type II CAAX endopeptidase family protein [Thermodesulfobacteriota bacterium]|nr:type II CAAX endopeptidase family protein [Thermodesulfobacteriota bacterium]
MQDIFSIPKRWHDPVSSLTRASILILTILVVEYFAFVLKDTYFPFPSIYLLAFLRAADLLILLTWGPWIFKGSGISKRIKEAAIVTLFFTVSGLLFLICWKNIFGASMLRLNDMIFHQRASELIAFYITSCLLSPVVEEFIFRGILYRKVREKWNMWICIGVISTIFALIHLYFNGRALMPFLGSLIFCLGYEKTKFILAPIFLHISGNMIIFLSPFIPFI